MQSVTRCAGEFAEALTGEVSLPDQRAEIVEKVAEYLVFQSLYTEDDRVDFGERCKPELALELWVFSSCALNIRPPLSRNADSQTLSGRLSRLLASCGATRRLRRLSGDDVAKQIPPPSWYTTVRSGLYNEGPLLSISTIRTPVHGSIRQCRHVA